MPNVLNSSTLFSSDHSLPWNKKNTSALTFGPKCRAFSRYSFAPDPSTLNPFTLDSGASEKSSMTSPGDRAVTFSDLRMERIANIREAIANGSYFVSSADLADKLMSYAER